MKNIITAVFIAVTSGANAGTQQVPAASSAAAVFTSFTSSAPAPGTCECRGCIVVYGDSRSNHKVHAKIAARIQARRPEAVFHTGDLVNSGRSAKDWEKFSEITKDLRAGSSFYAVLGNHEAGGEETFTELFRYPGNGRWYRVDLHGIRFFMLDFLLPLKKGTEQFKWLEAGLASPMGTNKFTAIVVHKPLASSGKHWDEKWKAEKDLEELFFKYKVALVLAGHDHNYERLEKGGMVYVVAGGGGAKLRPMGTKSKYSKVFAQAYHYVLLSVCGEELKLEVFDIEDAPLDSFRIPPGPGDFN